MTLNRRGFLLSTAAAAAFAATHALSKSEPADWIKLPTEAYPGKQDDIFFVTRLLGWYGNGKGRIFKTADGGASWTKIFDQPGTFVRALGFIDASIGVMGNVGPGSFPGVTDPEPIYRTTNGGTSWMPVRAITGPVPTGICAVDVLDYPFVNAGNLDRRPTIFAGGRVGGPAVLLRSTDLGASWTSRDLSDSTGMILDVKFISERIGFIAGSSSADVEASHARILATRDAGATWRTVYEGRRPWEITWKISFPAPGVGYVTVQSYNPDKSVTQRYVVKTNDGGETWTELPLISDPEFTEFGIGFLDTHRGWVGGRKYGMQTRDGGQHWSRVEFGEAVNKIRIVKDHQGIVVFAIGSSIYRLTLHAL